MSVGGGDVWCDLSLERTFETLVEADGPLSETQTAWISLSLIYLNFFPLASGASYFQEGRNYLA